MQLFFSFGLYNLGQHAGGALDGLGHDRQVVVNAGPVAGGVGVGQAREGGFTSAAGRPDHMPGGDI